MQRIWSFLRFWRSLPRNIHIAIILGSIVLIGVLAVLFLWPHSAGAPEASALEHVPEVTVSSEYANGEYVVSGTVSLKNRCQRLDTMGSVDETTSPVTVRVDLTSDYDEGICLELPDVRTFELTVPGPEGAHVRVFVNGIPQEGDAL